MLSITSFSQVVSIKKGDRIIDNAEGNFVTYRIKDINDRTVYALKTDGDSLRLRIFAPRDLLNGNWLIEESPPEEKA